MKSWLCAGFAAAVGLAAQGPAQPRPAERWSAFGADNEGEYFYDPRSVERSGGMIRYRVRAVVHPHRHGDMRSMILHVELNCSEQSSSILSVETFDASGRRLQAFSGEEAIPRPDEIQANSPEATLYRRLCPRGLVRPLPAPPRVVMVTPMAPQLLPPPLAPLPPPLVRVDPSGHPASRAEWRTPPSSLITADDYPAAALRAGEQGRVAVLLEVSRDGRITGCMVTRSSGSAVLDSTTCSLLVRRARFTPARDQWGEPMADRASTGVTWVLPPEPEPEVPGEEASPQPPDEQS